MMEEVVDDVDDGDDDVDQNTADSQHDVDQANIRDDAVRCFKNHTGVLTGTMWLKIFKATANLNTSNFPFQLAVNFAIKQVTHTYLLKHTCKVDPNLTVVKIIPSFLAL